MIYKLKTKWKLYELGRKIRSIHKEYRNKMYGGVKTLDLETLKKLKKEKTNKLWPYIISKKEIENMYILDMAEKYNIELPEIPDSVILGDCFPNQANESEYWTNLPETENMFLTDKAKRKLKIQIKDELKKNIEIYIPIVSLIIGLMGLLVAVLALIIANKSI